MAEKAAVCQKVFCSGTLLLLFFVVVLSVALFFFVCGVGFLGLLFSRTGQVSVQENNNPKKSRCALT